MRFHFRHEPLDPGPPSGRLFIRHPNDLTEKWIPDLVVGKIESTKIKTPIPGATVERSSIPGNMFKRFDHDLLWYRTQLKRHGVVDETDLCLLKDPWSRRRRAVTPGRRVGYQLRDYHLVRSAPRSAREVDQVHRLELLREVSRPVFGDVESEFPDESETDDDQYLDDDDTEQVRQRREHVVPY